MCEEAIRFRHHFLINDCILSVCTSLNHETRDVAVGWSIFNSADRTWIKKVGNGIARKRMKETPLMFNLSKDEPIICDYISLRALLIILGASKREYDDTIQDNTPRAIYRDTLLAIEYEMIRVLSLLGERVGLPSITSGEIN